MTANSVADLFAVEVWAIAQADTSVGPAFIRYRQPVLGPVGTEGYHKCLRVVWPYAEEGSGVLPLGATGEALVTFENHLVPALEANAVAVLAAVLTFDGARQWVFYSGNIQECGARINAMPQEAEPYPIELDAFEDPEWRYLREEVLARVPRDA